MKNFIEIIKKNDKKLIDFFEKKELENFEKTYNNLEAQHQEIKDNLKEINYLLELIENHQIEDSNTNQQQNREYSENWLSKLEEFFEKIHLKHTDKLTQLDIEFLQKEKSKLNFEKGQLEKEHHHIHQLIAKATIYLMNLRNVECEEITKGHDIAGVGEKLLEHFGKIINEEGSYDFGRKKIIKFLKNLFSLNKIQANRLFNLLEKSRVLHYEVDYLNIIKIPEYENFDEFTDLNYIPLFGSWFINA